MKIKALSIAALMGLLLAAPAMADTVIYSENFNAYSNGTLLSTVPGFYDWTGGANIPTIVGGAVVANGATLHDTLIDIGSDAFSHGSNHVTIEFDMTVPQAGEMNVLIAPGNAPALSFNYGQMMGYQSGWYTPHYVYAFAGSGADYGDVRTMADAAGHFLFDITKTGTTVSYSGFLNGNPIWTGGSGNVHSYTLSDGAGMNTIEIAGQYTGGPTQSYDNIKVTAIIAQSAANIVANPASPGALNMGLVAVSTISAPQTVTLSNLGDLPGTVTSATLSGPFSFSGTVPGGTIAGHADSVYNVVLDPQTVPTNVPRGTPYTGTATFVTSSGTFTYDLTADVYAHAGDVNGDGQVSLLDYNVVKANFGNAYESGNHWGDGDVNGDLQVGLLDFNIVKAHFGHTTGDGAAVTAVPEPATMSLLALAGLAALRRKR